MKKIHFEIGCIDRNSPYTGAIAEETESVFSSTSLPACLREWVLKGYTEPKYFIDIWEQDGENNPSFPIADIKVEPWVLEDYRLELEAKKKG
jgi:hypothetical protein